MLCKPQKRHDIKQINIDERKFWDSDEENLSIVAVTSDENLKFEESDNEWSIDLYTNGTLINFKTDSGIQVNILPLNEHDPMQNHPKLHLFSIKLSAYNGSRIPLKGSCIVRVKHNQSTTPVWILVADTNSTPKIRLNTSTKLNLIKRAMQIISPPTNYLKEFRNCFNDMACLPGKHHIVKDGNHPPHSSPPRQIQYALREKLKAELNRMVEMKINQAVNEPTDWINNSVLVEKPNGSLIICIDLKELNKDIKRPQYFHPTAEDILSQMSRAKHFTKFDANSFRFLTFISPFGDVFSY